MNEDILKKTCCFTGHRDISKIKVMELKLKLPKIIEKLITEKCVIYFGVGGALGFDMLAEKSVLKLKKKYPFIKLILVLPCKNHNKNWKIADKLELNFIAKQADKISYISENYTPYCITLRNRRLVNNSKYCICYLNKPTGGTAYTVNYAQENGLEIINLA